MLKILVNRIWNYIYDERSIALSVATFAGILAFMQFNQAQLASSVETRISACVVLSQHHFDLARRAEEDSGDPNYTSHSNIYVHNLGTYERQTGNLDRAELSIGMARALTLCVVEDQQGGDLADCIDNDINSSSYLKIIDFSSIKEIDGEMTDTGYQTWIC